QSSVKRLPSTSATQLNAERVEVRVRRLFSSNGTDFLLIFGVVLLLLVLGVVMVFSSMSVNSLANGGSSFSGLIRQLPFVAVGIPAALVLSNIPRRSWEIMAPLIYGGVIVALLLVFTALGQEVDGN